MDPEHISGDHTGLLFLGKARPSSKGGIKVKAWKQRWVVLAGSSLYYYHKKTSFAPSGVLELQKLDIIEDPDKTDRNYTFGLKDGSKDKLYLIAATTKEEMMEWLGMIKSGKGKEAIPPPANPSATPKKGLKYAFETNVASSLLGRKIVKEAIPEPAWEVLGLCCSYLQQVRGEETAKKFKKYFLKIGTKLAVLNYNKIVEDDLILRWRKFFLKLASVSVDYYQMPSIFDCAIIVQLITAYKKDTYENLAPKLSAGSVEKLDFLFSIGLDEALINDFFQKKKWKELEAVATIIRTNLESDLRQTL